MMKENRPPSPQIQIEQSLMFKSRFASAYRKLFELKEILTDSNT